MNNDPLNLIKNEESDAINRLGYVDIESLIKRIGIQLDSKAILPEGISGQIERLSSGQYKISANANEHLHRRRFTMAHELGHYLYHKSLIGDGVDDNIAYRSTEKGRFFNKNIEEKEETEANQFAASILMPWTLINALQDEGFREKEKIAEKLLVSVEALEYRLEK